MKRKMMVLGSCLLALLLLLSCAPGGGPEAAAKAAFEQWAQQNGVPYKDARFQTLNDDGVFATVRITAMFKESPEAPWLEHEAEVECRKVGREWQAEAWMYFQLTTAERERQQRRANATATAKAVATATAATARAAATATAETAATVTAEAQLASLKDVGRITFMSRRDGNWEVYVMNADGTGLVNLTNNPADDGGPAWSR